MKTYCAGVLHHCVSEVVVSLCFELQVVGALQDYSFLIVAHLLILIAHRVLAVVGDGLRCLFGEQADESHLHCHRVGRLIFVAVSELKEQMGSQCRASQKFTNKAYFTTFNQHSVSSAPFSASFCRC